MPGQCSELWSERSSERTVNGWVAYRSWLCTNVTSDDEAVNSVPLEGDRIAQVGESHPSNGGLLVRSLLITPKGPRSKVVKAVYSTPPAGSFEPRPDDPLQRGWDIETTWSSETVYDECDADGVPYVNTAGFPFEKSPGSQDADIGFQLSRWEPFFPLQKAIRFKYKVNDGPVEIPKIGSVNGGQLMAGVMTHEPYYETAKVVRVHYHIRIREEGWFDRLRDQSFSGHYYKSAASGGGAVGPTPGPLCSEDGATANEPVLLDGRGIPAIAKQRWVLNPSTNTPEAAVGPPVNRIPAEYIEPTGQGEGQVTFIKFKRGKRISFANFFR